MNIKDCKKINQTLYIGFFDHLHYGHYQLLSKTKNADVLTFINIPRKSTAIYPLDKRIKDLQSLGFKNVYYYDIVKNNQTALEFINWLKALGVKKIIVGNDFKLGKDQLSVNEIKKMIDVEVIEKNNISTTKIKQLLGEGKILEANKLTINPYTIEGKVVHGNQRARILGYPTANLSSIYHVILKDGVYLTKTRLNDTIYPSITFVGKNKTFTNKKHRVETHLFDFKQDLYGKRLFVEFYDYLCEVKKFKNIEELKVHINKLVKKAKNKINNL